MKEKGLKVFIMFVSLAAAVMLFVGPESSIAGPKEVRFKFASPFPEASVLSYGPVQFMRIVEERTKERIKFQRFWGGTLVKPREVVDSCGKGVMDVVHGLWIYDPGKLPLGNYDNNFFFNDPDFETQAKIKREMFEAVPALGDELAKYNLGPPLQFMVVSSYDFLAKIPLKTLGDFNGKKIAHTPVEFVPAFKAIGAVSVISPAGGMYNMLERGVVQITSIPTEIFDMFKLQEVAGHYTTAGFVTPCPVSLWINKDSWNSLSAEDKKLFVEVGKEADKLFVKNLRHKLDVAYENYRKAGLKFYTLSDADKKKWAAAMPDMPAEWAKKMEGKGLPGWKVVDKYMEISAKHGWKFPRQWGKR